MYLMAEDSLLFFISMCSTAHVILISCIMYKFVVSSVNYLVVL